MTKKAAVIMAILFLLLVETAIAMPKTKEPKPKPPKVPNNPKETINFTESVTLTAGNIYLGNQRIENGILYVQDAISTGKINSGESPISGLDIYTSLSGTFDLNTYLGFYEGKWIITSQSGTFKGTITGEVSVATLSGRFVGHGTGDFENQKIKGTYEGSVNNFQVQIKIQATITCKTN